MTILYYNVSGNEFETLDEAKAYRAKTFSHFTIDNAPVAVYKYVTDRAIDLQSVLKGE